MTDLMPDTQLRVSCPRCHIEHLDYQRARRWVLCVDCREVAGRDWAQRARNELAALARQPDEKFRCGHPKDDANTYRRPDGRNPECLTCKRKNGRRSA